MSHFCPNELFGDDEQDTGRASISVLSLASVLLEVTSMQKQNIGGDVREALDECEGILLDRIGAIASDPEPDED